MVKCLYKNFAYPAANGTIYLMTRHTIGRYELKAELGRGGMATVFLAHDPKFKRDVAIKVLPREFLHDSTFRARFEREAQLIGRLETSVAIVPVYDVGEEAGQPYLVMRYLDGGSLTNRLQRGPMLTIEIIDILHRLAPALDEAHQEGIIHRDLKPDNILFDHNFKPYITDFGIAKLTEGSQTLTSGGIVIGTPAYLSPEQANGETLDGRSDIYSLGVILFEMLTGKLPYQSSTPIGLIMKHLTEPVPDVLAINPQLPHDCNRVIVKAMAKTREDRYSTATALAYDFERSVDSKSWPDMSIFDTGAEQAATVPAQPAPVQPVASPPPVAVEPAPPVPEKQVDEVICPNCHTGNLPQVRFCKSCNTRLKVGCPLCHTENSIKETHCTNCGSEFKNLRSRRQQSSEARQQVIAQRVQGIKEGEARQLRDQIQGLLSDLTGWRTKTNALRQLNRVPKKVFDTLWENLLNDREVDSRFQTAKVLAQICTNTDIKASIRQQAVDALIDVADDPEPNIQQLAQEVLDSISDNSTDNADMLGGILGWLKGKS